MNFDLSHLINLLSSIPLDTVLALAGGGAGVSTVQQLAKAKLEKDTRKLSDGSNILVTVALVSAVTAFAQFDGLIQASPNAFGATFAALWFATHVIFKLGINKFSKWYGNLLADARKYRSTQADEAQG